MVIVFDAKVADTPAGNPFAPETPLFAMPVVPVVAIVIAVSAVLIHKVGELDGAAAVLFGVTTTFVVEGGELGQPSTSVTVKEYVPAVVTVGPAIVLLGVNAPGPDQE